MVKLNENFRQTNLYLDDDTVMLAKKKLFEMTGSRRALSSFVNRILEEFILEDEQKETSIRQMARELTDRIRHEKMAQRKLVTETTLKKTKLQGEIERETRRAIDNLGFKPEWIRDRPGYNFSHHRAELADEVTFAVGQDLQWKDIAPIVTAALLEVRAS